jgi:RNA polymerase sigma factor (sigma-70 family)
LACRELIDGWGLAVKAIASRYASRLSDLDDLMQVGRLAVYQSALNYDPTLDVPFGNYTKRAIKNCVMQEAARLTRQRRLEVSPEGRAEKGDDQLEGLLDDGGQARQVKEWVLELPEPHATIFRLLYVERKTQRVVAEEIGVSQPRVAQLHRSFLDLAWATFTA